MWMLWYVGGHMEQTNGFKKLALIVEDNPSDVIIAKAALEAEGLIPMVANDGFAALDQMDRMDFSIIIVDLQMPHMSGMELLRRFQNIEKYRHIPILVTSGRNEARDIKSAISLGASDYLIKPIDPMIFKTKVEAAVRRDKTQWYEYNFDKDNIMNQVEINLSLSMKSINELGAVIETPFALPIDFTFPLNSSLLNQLEVEEILAKVIDVEKTTNGTSLVSVIFVGLNEEKRKKLRIFCRGIWNQKGRTI